MKLALLFLVALAALAIAQPVAPVEMAPTDIAAITMKLTPQQAKAFAAFAEHSTTQAHHRSMEMSVRTLREALPRLPLERRKALLAQLAQLAASVNVNAAVPKAPNAK